MTFSKTLRGLMLAAGLISTAFTGASMAQTFPTKPISLVVPFAAGGPTDILARTIAASMTKDLGQTVVVENRAGAGGTIASAFVAKAPADGLAS